MYSNNHNNNQDTIRYDRRSADRYNYIYITISTRDKDIIDIDITEGYRCTYREDPQRYIYTRDLADWWKIPAFILCIGGDFFSFLLSAVPIYIKIQREYKNKSQFYTRRE